jgi:hypothetical protein
MIKNYTVSCKCGFTSDVSYGRENKDNIFEVFSCNICKNLFSLKIDKDRKCVCGNDKLKLYVPDKKENLSFYRKMAELGKIDEEKLKQLTDFWSTIDDKKCPICENEYLIWRLS